MCEFLGFLKNIPGFLGKVKSAAYSYAVTELQFVLIWIFYPLIVLLVRRTCLDLNNEVRKFTNGNNIEVLISDVNSF